jgi:hypothetical protein
MTICFYCRKRLVQPIVRHYKKEFHLECYVEKDDGKIFTKSMRDYIIRKLEFMGEICDNALDCKLSIEERHTKFEAIKEKYADC